MITVDLYSGKNDL